MEPKKMNISNENVNGVLEIMKTTKTGNKEDFLKTSEYREFYDGERLFNRDCT